jgi:hypothetical protein
MNIDCEALTIECQAEADDASHDNLYVHPPDVTIPDSGGVGAYLEEGVSDETVERRCKMVVFATAQAMILARANGAKGRPMCRIRRTPNGIESVWRMVTTPIGTFEFLRETAPADDPL